MIILIIILVWLFFGFLGYGIAFAAFQRVIPILAKKEYKKDLFFCLSGIFFGPINFVVVVSHFWGRFKGFKII